MPGPLVSVICLCYNHQEFVAEAVNSILNQTYTNIELIIVDDASADKSSRIIQDLAVSNPAIKFIQLEKNVGNCTAFNIGLRQSNGEYIIDFAADDILLPQRIEIGVKALEKLGKEHGVQFSDAQLIDAHGNLLGLHSDKYLHETIPTGDIYLDLIKNYFICAPTMLIRKDVLELLNGYDESLAYEDFDFWIRSARHFKYVYLSDVLVKRRVLSNSMRSTQFTKGSKQLKSTYRVCLKINELNKTKAERNALKFRLIYELKVCLRLFEFGLAINYLKLLSSLKG